MAKPNIYISKQDKNWIINTKCTSFVIQHYYISPLAKSLYTHNPLSFSFSLHFHKTFVLELEFLHLCPKKFKS